VDTGDGDFVIARIPVLGTHPQVVIGPGRLP